VGGGGAVDVVAVVERVQLQDLHSLVPVLYVS